jgi:hypothetical protein
VPQIQVLFNIHQILRENTMKPSTMLIATTLLATTALSNVTEAAPPLLPPTVYTINWYNDTFPASACSFVSVRTLASNGAAIKEKTNATDLAYRKTLIMDIPSAGIASPCFSM